MLYWEQISPSHVGKGGFAPLMRLNGLLGVCAGFLFFAARSTCTFTTSACRPPHDQRPCSPCTCVREAHGADCEILDRFYGVTENAREVEMDMREMVDKVKRGEPLYGATELTDYMQGVAARNSRYSAIFLHVVPMFNFTNHSHHGVDTAKYYQQAERELEAERLAKSVEFKDGKV